MVLALPFCKGEIIAKLPLRSFYRPIDQGPDIGDNLFAQVGLFIIKLAGTRKLCRISLWTH